jgi:hypothetical protein
MELQILLFSLFISAALPLLVLTYLRAVLHKLLGSVCGNTDAADFWFRCLQILAISGSVILVIGFVPAFAGEDWVQVVRITLILTSIGIFAAIAIVARSIWLSVVKPAIQVSNTVHSSTFNGGLK